MDQLRTTAWIATACIYIAMAFTNFFVPFPPMAIIPFHVYMTSAIVLLFRPFNDHASVPPRVGFGVDLALFATCLWLAYHYWTNAERLQLRMAYVDDVFLSDIVAMFAGLIVLLEAVRRVVGLPLLSVLLVCLAYAFFGQHLPSFLSFVGFSISELTEILSMQPLGLFDVPAQVGLDIIVYFVVFGAIFLYFRSKGGYRPIELTEEGAGKLEA